MATRRRRKGGRRRVHARRNPVNPVNPTRRRRHARRSTRRHRVFARRYRNPINPSRHRRRGRRRHHRNPLGHAGGEILNFTVAGILQGIATPIFGRFVGGFLPFGQYNPAVLAIGTGWALSKLLNLFGATRRFSHAALVFGAAAGAMQILQPIVSRAIAGVGGAQNPTMQGMHGWTAPYAGFRPRGMAGIGVVTGQPPMILAPPPPLPSTGPGMHGIGMRPGYPGF